MTEENTTTAQQAQNVETPAAPKMHRASKGEKKFKKAMSKMGMKPVEGITRVTLKTNKNFILYIDNPEVMKTNNDASYLVFGETKFQDFKDMARDIAGSLGSKKEEAVATPTPVTGDAVDGEPVEAEGISEESITTLMEYSKCTRADAITAL